MYRPTDFIMNNKLTLKEKRQRTIQRVAFIIRQSKTFIKNSDIIGIMYNKYREELSQQEVRAIIHVIRKENLVPNLIASSYGYRVEKDKLKVFAYTKKLELRAKSIMQVASAMRKHAR